MAKIRSKFEALRFTQMNFKNFVHFKTPSPIVAHSSCQMSYYQCLCTAITSRPIGTTQAIQTLTDNRLYRYHPHGFHTSFQDESHRTMPWQCYAHGTQVARFAHLIMHPQASDFIPLSRIRLRHHPSPIIMLSSSWHLLLSLFSSSRRSCCRI